MRGELRMHDSPFGPLPGLVVRDAWQGVTGQAPPPRFFGVVSSGIVCFTFPCPSFRAQILNKRGRRMVHEVDLASSGATPEQLDRGQAALYGDGLLVAGHRELFQGPAGRGVRLVAGEFYTRVAPGSGGACSATDPLPPPPDACLTLWDPVCGCDGKTYGNRCELERAQVRLVHLGACAGPR